MNGSRRILQTNLGWLEGKISDVIHHGSGYKDMIQKGKDYMKMRKNKSEVAKVTKEIVEINNKIVQAEEAGETVTELSKELEILQNKKEEIQSEKDAIPIVIQKPIEEQTLDMFMQQQEIDRLEKQYHQTKAEEVIKYRDEITEEKYEAIRLIEEDRYETIRELNETKLLKSEEMDAIKYELDLTKAEIEEAQVAINRLINIEENVTKIEQMTYVMNSLQDTKGKISFTQVQIMEDEVSMYDSRPMEMRAPHSEEDVPVEYEKLEEREEREEHNIDEITYQEHQEPTWSEEVIEDITKSCSKVRDEDICVCSNKVTREVYKC